MKYICGKEALKKELRKSRVGDKFSVIGYKSYQIVDVNRPRSFKKRIGHTFMVVIMHLYMEEEKKFILQLGYQEV